MTEKLEHAAAALRERGLMAAARIAAHGGIALLAETFPTRLERGAGLPPVERIAYLAELASTQLAEVRNLILVDAKAPVSFFGYPGKKSYLVPDTCTVHTLATPAQDAAASLEKLAAILGAANAQPVLQPVQRPTRPRGRLTAAALSLPESVALGDPAMLLPQVSPCPPLQPAHIGFMPHFESLEHGRWPQAAAAAGFSN